MSMRRSSAWSDRATPRHSVKRPQILHLTADVTGFAETAALLSCLDLTVDASVAYLVALGRPLAIVALCSGFSLAARSRRQPWYQTVRLFRQGASREYESSIVCERNCRMR